MKRSRFKLQRLQVRVKAARLRPEAAELAAGDAPQASEAASHNTEALHVKQLLG